MKPKLIITAFILLFSMQLNAQYTINDVFSDPNETTYMTRDIFAVWWDSDFNFAADADILLDQMIVYKDICLNQLNMENPPSPTDGYYFNVYLFSGGYYSNFGWGNGVGTDSNGYPYLTLPYGFHDDLVNLAHETFHIFQYNSNSSGFSYSGDSQWYIEASANWFAAIQNQDNPRSLIESESLVRVPHVPLWLSYNNFPANYPENWQRYVHQYALALLMYYLTEEASVPDNIIVDGFYANTSELPQEYLFNQIGGSDFRNHILDWVAHMTNDFDFLSTNQKISNLNEWNIHGDASDDNEFTEVFDNSGTNEWYRPVNLVVTNAWSFNTYKLENTGDYNYSFEINGDPAGSYNDLSLFQGKILVKNSNGTTNFYDIPMTNAYQGALSINISSTDTEIYFIIASMPEIFEDPNQEFQLFSYEMRITNNSLNVSDFNSVDFISFHPNPIKHNFNIVFEQYQNNINIELYSTLGRRVLEQNYLKQQQVEMDFSEITSGIYFIKISTDNKSKTLKLVKL